MWTKPYGSTGKDVSVVSFGGMRFDKNQDHETNAGVVRHAFDRGVNYFDTAPGYADSEDIFGVAFREMPRDEFLVATKSMKSDGAALRRELETSLRRMGVEKIDFFHIWCLKAPEEWEQRKSGGAVDAAMKAKAEGLVEHVVCSSHMAGPELREVLAEGYFEGVLLGYCAINFPYREEAVRAAGELGLGVVTMNPLGGGIIPQNRERFDFLRGPEDRSVVEAAVRFNVSHLEITSALVGFTTTDQVDEVVDAVEGFEPWPAERIDAVREQVVESFDELCTGCGYCLPCPQGVNIPRMMDAYNHKILQGGDQAIVNRLKWHWGLTLADAEACSLCGQCEPRCTQKLPIRKRMEEIQAIAGREE